MPDVWGIEIAILQQDLATSLKRGTLIWKHDLRTHINILVMFQ